MIRSTNLWLVGLAITASACGGASGDDLFGKGSLGKSPPASGGAASAGGSGGGWTSGGGSAGRPGPGGDASGASAGGGGDSGSSAATGGSGSTPAGGGSAGTAATGGASGATGGSGGAATAAQCQSHCGGPSADQSCWCDALCSLYGDCCSDFASSCPAEASAPPPTGGCTPGLCGSEQPSSENGVACYCDGACAQYGDCCSNKQAVCGG